MSSDIISKLRFNVSHLKMLSIKHRTHRLPKHLRTDYLRFTLPSMFFTLDILGEELFFFSKQIKILRRKIHTGKEME